MFEPAVNQAKAPKVCSMCSGRGHWARQCANNFEEEEPDFSTLNINGMAHQQRLRDSTSTSASTSSHFRQNSHQRKEKPNRMFEDEIQRGDTNSEQPRKVSHQKKEKPNRMIEDEIQRSDANSEQPRKAAYIPPVPTDISLEIGNRIGENFHKYKNVKTSISGEQAPLHIDSFDEYALDQTISENMRKMHMINPTPIQKCALPAIELSRDVMACATTGSGKTAAFLIPVLCKMIVQYITPTQNCPVTLIISPTKELARQIHDDVRKLSHNTRISSCLVYGGVSVPYQIGEVAKGCDVVVATPGRLLHFLERGIIKLINLKHFILDEADTMLKMDFIKDIKKIISNYDLPNKAERQMLMFSATFPPEVQMLARNFLCNNYLYITIGVLGSACKDVKQNIFNVEPRFKKDKLLQLLDDIDGEKVLIFVGTRKYADFLASYLSQNGRCATTIHGDREQCQREEALSFFKSNKCSILIATDVMSRGHDISDLKHVIIFDMPDDMDSYVHRIGRTGRLGNIGSAYVLFSPKHDADKSRTLVKILSEAQQEVPNWLEGLTDNFHPYREPEIRANSYDTSRFTSQTNDDSEDDWD